MYQRLLPDDGLEKHAHNAEDIEDICDEPNDGECMKGEGRVFSKDGSTGLKEHSKNDEGKMLDFYHQSSISLITYCWP